MIEKHIHKLEGGIFQCPEKNGRQCGILEEIPLNINKQEYIVFRHICDTYGPYKRSIHDLIFDATGFHVVNFTKDFLDFVPKWSTIHYNINGFKYNKLFDNDKSGPCYTDGLEPIFINKKGDEYYLKREILRKCIPLRPRCQVCNKKIGRNWYDIKEVPVYLIRYSKIIEFSSILIYEGEQEFIHEGCYKKWEETIKQLRSDLVELRQEQEKGYKKMRTTAKLFRKFKSLKPTDHEALSSLKEEFEQLRTSQDS